MLKSRVLKNGKTTFDELSVSSTCLPSAERAHRGIRGRLGLTDVGAKCLRHSMAAVGAAIPWSDFAQTVNILGNANWRALPEAESVDSAMFYLYTTLM